MSRYHTPSTRAHYLQVIAVILVISVSLLFGYYVLRRMRAKGKEPKFLPGSFFKRKWQSWTPNSKYRQVDDSRGSQDLTAANTTYNRAVETEERAATQAVAAGVDRNTSVRSVMTLPAYHPSPNPGEEVIGREGERGGMDTVVEFPETNDEEETRREDQMESLYQIRLARRREIAEREERRRERREAREAGDTTRLEQLRIESRQRANGANSTDNLNGGLSASAATLIAEHQSRGRDRRVSAVSYGDVGHVRHDGTRLRANSNDSERGGLLDGAAPMGEEGDRPRASSDAGSSLAEPRPAFRNRDRSGSSALSISTTASDLEQPRPFTPGSTQHGESDRPPRTSDSNNTSNSSPTDTRFTPEESTGSEGADVPIVNVESPSVNQPPEYDELEWGDAPAYSEHRASLRRSQQAAEARRSGLDRNASNASQRAFDALARRSVAPQLPELNLPRISVQGATEPNTPVTPNMTVGSPEVGGRGNRDRRSRLDRDENWDEV